MWSPAVRSSGAPAWQPPTGHHTSNSSNLPMIGCHCPAPSVAGMTVHGETVLRQRVCRGSGCQAVFWICPHCDRGQRYCSPTCRAAARLQQRRCANCRHQRSPEGRLDHRDRQRAYRRRLLLRARVTDQGSLSISSPASSLGEPVAAILAELPNRSRAHSLPGWPDQRPGVRLCCRICGRAGRFIDPFPRIPQPK